MIVIRRVVLNVFFVGWVGKYINIDNLELVEGFLER